MASAHFCYQVGQSSLAEQPESSRNSSTPKSRLENLRNELKRRNLDAIVIPTADAHSSEYPPARFERRAFISAFTGSAGTAVVTATQALMWTDGRYFLQAEEELSEEWTLMRQGEKGVPAPRDWIANSVPAGSRVAIDPYVHTVRSVKRLSKTLEASSIQLIRIEGVHPVDVVWGDSRPELPNVLVRKHPVKLAGNSVSTKLSMIREKIRTQGATHALASKLDEVCWIFNIRGGDVPHCPVVTSYALIGLSEAILYVDVKKVPDAVADTLAESDVEIAPYERICDDLEKLSEIGKNPGNSYIWMSPDSTSQAIYEAADKAAFLSQTPFALLKACKNKHEIAAIKSAHLKDGTAKCQFLRWLEDTVSNGGTITEYEAGVKLEAFRAKQEGFISTSFSTIAGFGSNGAIIHYSAKQAKCAKITKNEVFLLDSGGQYIDGTTDITRTMHFGAPTQHEKLCFTRVLQGHIALDRLVFPDGTTGLMVDAIARSPLWNLGLDYRHGTSHGVGASLNVHEGPQSISYRSSSNEAALQIGMVLSNEPGYYEDSKFGIRIENMMHVVEKNTRFRFGNKKYLGFEKLTFIPIDKNLIAVESLNDQEIDWVNSYHSQVWDNISPRLSCKKDLDWLRVKTAPISDRSQSNRYF